MPNRFLWIVIMLYWSACHFSNQDAPSFKAIPIVFPKTLHDTTMADTFNGKRVLDPFRWLENSNTSATRNWIIQQQTQTEKYLSQIPQRTAILKRLSELWNYKNESPPIQKGNFYYVLRQEKLQSQPILYQLRNWQDTIGRVILNLNSVGVSGAQLLQNFAFSQDGSLLAYEVAQNGARTSSIFVKDIESNRTLLDTLQGVKFSAIAWFRDGFFYSRYPPETSTNTNAPYQFQQIFYHRVGSPQMDDELIFADRSDPYGRVTAQTTTDERFLILYLQKHDSGNALYMRDLRSSVVDFTAIMENFDHVFKVIDNVNNDLLVYTNYKAPNSRLIRINMQRPEERFWENILPEEKEVLQTVHLYGGKLVALYEHKGVNQLKIFDLKGGLQREIPIPTSGQVIDWSGGADLSQAFFTISSLIEPNATYVLNTNDLTTNRYQQGKTDTLNYDIQQIRFNSYDGTEIPLTILAKKKVKLDGKRPTLLMPAYADFPMMQMILENDGVCAIVQVRGNKGLGENWRLAGVKLKKQSAIDDFQAAAEYLIAKKYTSPSKLAVYGKGDGGLVVGASVTQRSDIFKVALINAGILDLLRYQRHTIGWMWTSAYGTVYQADELDALLAYSPVHHVVPADYPATMILTSNRNQEVVSAHSYKFAAALQQHQRAQQPVLLRVAQGGEYELLSEQILKTTDMLTLLFYHLQETIKN